MKEWCISGLHPRPQNARRVIAWHAWDAQDYAMLPHNDVTSEIADVIAEAVRLSGGKDAAVLMIVQPGERNSYDQQARLHLWPLQHLCKLGVASTSPQPIKPTAGKLWQCTGSMLMLASSGCAVHLSFQSSFLLTDGAVDTIGLVGASWHPHPQTVSPGDPPARAAG